MLLHSLLCFALHYLLYLLSYISCSFNIYFLKCNAMKFQDDSILFQRFAKTNNNDSIGHAVSHQVIKQKGMTTSTCLQRHCTYLQVSTSIISVKRGNLLCRKIINHYMIGSNSHLDLFYCFCGKEYN